MLNSLGNEWTILSNVFFNFFLEKQNSTCYGNKIITDISINNYIQLLPTKGHKRLVDICHKMLKE